MKKRFIVLLASETDQQTRAFSNLLKPSNFAWWHWLPNSWIIIDFSGQLTPSSLRDKVKRIYPGVNNFVTEVKEDSWVGFGPGGDSTYFSWLKNHWS
jgi:hypothetical protein